MNARTRRTSIALLGATTLAALGLAPAQAASNTGSLSIADGVLPRAGACTTYPYAWHVDPAADGWRVDVAVSDAQGRKVASYYSVYDETETTATRTFTLCGAMSGAGTYTLSGTLLTDEGGSDLVAHPLPSTTFTLAKASRAKAGKGGKAHRSHRAHRGHRAGQAHHHR